uniref:Glutamyl-tRNA(Gln) amidotransferase subunit B, mitochondrial n=1 Tax=Acrobeloides nanus TaxID=290746 RepID=A0A914CBS9_9BILA
MPSGYQITQQDHPIAKNGYFDFYVHSQIQLETDSGKSLIHGDRHLVDLNRAGVGLIEIVTLPELHSPDEAMALMEQLRLYFVHNKICMGDLFKGQIRADANVSMRKDGVNYPRVEIKNINSMNHLRRAIEGEIERQRKILQEGGIVEEETRSLLDDNLTSKASRSKGDSLDYRIIPEPNLPRLIIEPKWIQEAKEQLRLDLQHLKYIKEYNMNPHAALQIATDASLNKFVSKSITGMKIPVEKFLDSLSALENICSKLHVHYPPDKENFPQIFVELLHLETTGRITRFICKDLIKFYLEANEFIPVEQKIEKERLWRITDPTDIMRAIEETMESFPKVVEKALLEDKKRNHFNKLRNEVVLLSKRKISMEDVEDGLTRKLSILKPK